MQQGVKDFLEEHSKNLQAPAAGKRKAQDSEKGSSKARKTAGHLAVHLNLR